MAIYQAEFPIGDISDKRPNLTSSSYNCVCPQYRVTSQRLDIIPVFLYHHHLLVHSVPVE